MDSQSGNTRKTGFYVLRIVGAILCVAMALVFFYSAYSKSGILFKGFRFLDNSSAFDNFQWAFLDMGLNSIFVTGIIARVMIGFELLLGLMLLCHVFLRRFTYKAIIAVLLFFIVYLLLVMSKQGNSGNCGCFGDQVAMTPLAAIIKNLIMIGATILLWFIYPIKPYKYQDYLSLLLGLIAFSLPFVVNPMYTGTGPVAWNHRVELGPLYQYDSIPKQELRTGRHIIGFMSLTCPHCRKAAHLLQIIHHEHPDLPIYFVLIGPQPFMQSFFAETGASGMPYLYYSSLTDFDNMINSGVEHGAHSGVPAIYWIRDGVIEYKSTYYQLDPALMEKWSHATSPMALK